MKIKNKSSAINEAERLISKSYILDDLIKEIKKLKRGEVKPKESKERAEKARRFSENGQRILSFIKLHGTHIKPELIKMLDKLRNKAETILRENPVLQTRSPIDVIKYNDMPLRYAINHLGKQEPRKGFGLHKLPTTEQGLSVCIAYMPSKHIQMYHNHTISEDTLILGNQVEGIFIRNKKRIKILAPSRSMLYFSRFTVHTIYNCSKKISRNITVKIPQGILDWKPFYLSKSVMRGTGKVITKANTILSNNDIVVKEFNVKHRFCNYDIELMYLKPNISYKTKTNIDRYFLVVQGNIKIIGDSVQKIAYKDDIMVIDKGTDYRLKTKKSCILYGVNNIKIK